MNSLFTLLRLPFVRLLRTRLGNVAMMWAISAPVVLALVGVSIDYTRANAARQQLQNAADGAALVAEKMASRPLLERQVAAEQYFRASLADADLANLAMITVSEVPGGGHKAAVTMPVKTTLSRLVTGNDFTVAANSTADEESGPVEVALVLDNTGSMSADMQALRDSAEDLVDIVFAAAEAPGLVEMAVVPFVAQVNIGNTAETMQWMDTAGTSPFNGEMLEDRLIARRSWTSVVASGLNCELVSPLPWAGYTGPFRIRWKRGGTTAGRAGSGSDTNYCYGYTPPSVPDTALAHLGLVPAGINHFQLFSQIPNTSWKGCVEARPAPFDIQDDAPTTPETRFVPYFWLDNIDTYNNSYLTDANGNITGATMTNHFTSTSTANQNRARAFNVFKYRGQNGVIDNTAPDTTGPNMGCPTPVVPLTPVKATVVNAVRGMLHWNGGGTNQAEGLAWGWRVLSPQAPFTQGAPYGQKRKVIVLMTDGQNTNINSGTGTYPAFGSDYSAYGFLSQWTASTASPAGLRDTLPAGYNRNTITSTSTYVNYINTRQAALCNNVKGAGIEVFAVMYRESNGAARDLLRACTSPDVAGVVHYHNADNAAELQTAFQSIGTSIGKLRLTR